MKIYEAPKKGDVLFLPDSGGEKTYASINRIKGPNHDHPNFLISDGYRNATQILLANIMDTPNRDWLAIDSLIYPILFNFRHYLEITIKATTRNYHIMTPGQYADDVGFISEHSLIKIWNVLKPHLTESYGDERSGIATIEAVEELLVEFDKYDSGSFTFRYAYKRAKAHDTLEYSVAPMTINLDNLREMTEKCFYYFDSIYWHSSAMLDDYQTVND